MKVDMNAIGQKAQSMKSHNANLQNNQMALMLKVYQLQRQKDQLAKINAKLKYINVLKQSLPVIQNLIETGCNFEVVLDLMENSENLIDEQLSQIKIAKIYKERLKEFKAKCTKRMESDFLAQIELQLKSRIQFKTPKITGF